jgi:hypothetical protein
LASNIVERPVSRKANGLAPALPKKMELRKTFSRSPLLADFRAALGDCAYLDFT